MSNEWNADSLKARTIISDNIVNTAGEKYVSSASNTSHHVGEQWISMDGTIPFGGVPFLGQQVSTEVYNELYNWAVENERLISETEWQSLYSSQNGNVPFYAYGEDATEGRRAWAESDIENYLLVEDISGGLGVYFNYYNEDAEGEVFDDESFIFVLPLPEDGIVTESFLQLVADSFNNLENNPITLSFRISSTSEGIFSIGFYAEFKEFGTCRYNNQISILRGATWEESEMTIGAYFEDEILPTPATQFRMPLYRGYLKAQTVAGSYIAEGLPNITGSITIGEGLARITSITNAGALKGTTYSSTYTGFTSTDEAYKMNKITLNASDSNAIYGASSHVTPETNTMLIGVYAFNEISNPAIVNSEDYRKAIINNEVKVDEYVIKVDGYENTILQNCPVGCIMMYAKSATPTGWLTCNGSTVSRTTYKDLFDVIGTTFGTGDDSTTFALPNLTDKFAMGNNTVGTTKAAGLPNITGALNNMSLNAVTPSASGAFTAAVSSSSGNGYAGYSHPYRNISFNASRSSSIYGAATTVQPPALTLRFIIKY